MINGGVISALDLRQAARELTRTRRPSRAAWLARPTSLFLASRLVCLAGAGAGALIAGGSFAKAVGRWDGAWYMATAANGYPHAIPQTGHVAVPTTAAFFPLFPASIAAVRASTRLPYEAAGLLLSSIFGLVATVLLWSLVHRVSNRRMADRACALWCFFPGSFVFSLVYAEGLLIALTVGCMLALLDRRWWLAGLLAAGATATKPTGWVLIVCCAYMAATAIHRDREWESITAPLMAPLGVLGYFVFLWAWTGDLGAWFRAESAWGQGLNPALPWNDVSFFFREPFVQAANTAQLAALLFVIVAAVLLIRSESPPILLIWVAGVVLVAAMSPASGGIAPRFILTAFPLVTALAWYVRGIVFWTAVAASAAMLGVLTAFTLSSLTLVP